MLLRPCGTADVENRAKSGLESDGQSFEKVVRHGFFVHRLLNRDGRHPEHVIHSLRHDGLFVLRLRRRQRRAFCLPRQLLRLLRRIRTVGVEETADVEGQRGGGRVPTVNPIIALILATMSCNREL